MSKPCCPLAWRAACLWELELEFSFACCRVFVLPQPVEMGFCRKGGMDAHEQPLERLDWCFLGSLKVCLWEQSGVKLKDKLGLLGRSKLEAGRFQLVVDGALESEQQSKSFVCCLLCFVRHNDLKWPCDFGSKVPE